MKKLFLTLIFILIASDVFAATNHFVRSGTTYNGDGSSWAAASYSGGPGCFNELPGKTSLVRGDTYYIADGSYGNWDLGTTSNGSYITIKKATQATNASDPGWFSSYGDGQAQINRVLIYSSYWKFDGSVGSLSGSYADYGFLFRQVSTTTTLTFIGLISTGYHNYDADYVEISHCAFVMPGASYDFYQQGIQSNPYINTCSYITVADCLFDGDYQNAMSIRDWDDSIIERCYFTGNQGGVATYKSQQITLGNGHDRLTIRDNIFLDTSYAVLGLHRQEGTDVNTYIYFYNNLMKGSVGDKGAGVLIDADSSRSDNLSNWYAHNNTTVDFTFSANGFFKNGTITNPTGSMCYSRNNLFVNCTVLGTSLFTGTAAAHTHTDNVFYACTGTFDTSEGGTAINVGSGDPFVDKTNSNYHLDGTKASAMLNQGYTLGSPYNTDFDSDDTVVRPYGAGYDAGIYEYLGGYIPPEEEDYTLTIQHLSEDEYASSNYDTDLDMYNDASGWITTKLAQSFVGTGRLISGGTFEIREVGTATGTAYYKIYAHTGTYGESSIPTGTALASGSFDVSTVGTSYVEKTVTFDTAYKSVYGTHYVMTIEYDGGSAANHIQVKFDATGSHDGNLAYWKYKGTSWNLYTPGDLIFEIVSSEEGSGTTTSESGINCGSTCSISVTGLTTETITATPAGGSETYAWFNTDGCTGNSCDLYMNSDKTVIIDYRTTGGAVYYPVTITKNGTGDGVVTSDIGDINCGDICSDEYIAGADPVFTATASPGSTFVEFTGDGTGEDDTRTITDIAAASSINAQFDALEPVVDTADPLANNSTKELYSYILSLDADNKILSGQQVYTYAGYGEMAAIYADTSRYPAVMGDELGGASSWNPLSAVSTALISWDIAGGVCTVTCHMNNPATGGTCYDTNIDLAALVTSGTASNAAFKTELDRLAVFFQTLEDADVPVIFRPFHEMNGGWFWWGGKDAAQYKNLWIYTFNYLTTTKGLHNILWSWSINANTGNTTLYYPGTDYVDETGIDHYNSIYSFELSSLADEYASLLTLGKPVALTEFGNCNGYDDESCVNKDYSLLLAEIQAHVPNISRFLVWTQAYQLGNQANVDDMFAESAILSRDEISIPDETFYQLTVTNGGDGDIEVTSSPIGINCGNDNSICTYSFLENTVVSLSYNMLNGSTFNTWGGDCSGTGICQLTMTEDKDVTTSSNAKASSVAIQGIGIVGETRGRMFVPDANGVEVLWVQGVVSDIIDYYPESNANYGITVGNGAEVEITAVAQSFTGNGEELDKASTYLKKVGSPTGNITIKLYDETHSVAYGTDSIPTGAALDTLGTIDITTLGDSYLIISIIDSTPYQTVDGAHYELSVEYDNGDSSNYLLVGSDISGTHGGNFSDYTGTWGYSDTDDIIFYAITE